MGGPDDVADVLLSALRVPAEDGVRPQRVII